MNVETGDQIQPDLITPTGKRKGYNPKSGRVVGGPAPDQKPDLKAVHSYLTLTCTEFDLEALREFTDEWRADPRMRQVG
ncbi:hypothetical protein PV726_36065 [Streptomyces europaeiscabiei]|uniref:hypothetical protein n=1 Tax=Streptomyces europaeiscabiei TaxID=146819 RepID=UPI0029A095B7|nr:hypothetical protein [Streptomyces europaeiscabiei]MDX3695649.1 hypothetical protein [Streptomyces europaeiscabiei]